MVDLLIQPEERIQRCSRCDSSRIIKPRASLIQHIGVERSTSVKMKIERKSTGDEARARLGFAELKRATMVRNNSGALQRVWPREPQLRVCAAQTAGSEEVPVCEREWGGEAP